MSSVARIYLTLMAALAAIAVAPAAIGWEPSVVRSGSMEPGISPGDVVLTAPLRASEPVPLGSVVSFTDRDQLILHRIIVTRDDGTFITAGDANPQPDVAPIARDDIVGQAVLLVPFVGLPGLWASHGQHLYLILWIGWTGLAIAVAAIRSGGERDSGESGSRRAGVAKATTVTGVSVVAALALTPLAAPHGMAGAAFTASSSTGGTWHAKAYTPLTMGSATEFAALAFEQVSGRRTAGTVGLVGTSPGEAIGGIGPGDIAGTIESNTPRAGTAMADAVLARSAVAERPTTITIGPLLSGTYTPGVYEGGAEGFTVSGTVVLDARGDPSARFIFRTSGGLDIRQRSTVTLTGGARASNVWWVAGTTMTAGQGLGATTRGVGNYLVNGNVNLRGVEIDGRVVSYAGAIDMDTTRIDAGN